MNEEEGMMPKRKLVYVVTSGSYSDYGVNAIFSTRKKAEEWISEFPDPDCNGITEWRLDPVDARERKMGRSLWFVRMLRDGATKSVEQVSNLSRYALTDDFGIHRPFGTPAFLVASVWATDSVHAVKIVKEIRTRLIAEGMWEADAAEAANA